MVHMAATSSRASKSKDFSWKNISPGMYLVVHIVKQKNGKMILEPVSSIPKEQKWFWTPQWQEKEKEAARAIVEEELFGPFETAKDLAKSLKS